MKFIAAAERNTWHEFRCKDVDMDSRTSVKFQDVSKGIGSRNVYAYFPQAYIGVADR